MVSSHAPLLECSEPGAGEAEDRSSYTPFQGPQSREIDMKADMLCRRIGDKRTVTGFFCFLFSQIPAQIHGLSRIMFQLFK